MENVDIANSGETNPAFNAVATPIDSPAPKQVAGGLPFKKPITDNETLDATTDSGLYQVSGFSSIPYGILIVFEGSNLVCQKLIGSASILFRMKSKTSSWPVWKELKGVEHQTVL